MSQNVYQFIDLQRVDPPKKPLKIRKIEFVEIYEPFSEGQAKAQADRCLSCGNPYCDSSAASKIRPSLASFSQFGM